MTSAPSTTQPAELPDGARTSAPLVVVPSWVVSFGLHALLLFLLASGLKSCEGELTGGPEQGARVVGLYDRTSNQSLEQADETADESTKFEQPLSDNADQPLLSDAPPSALETPQVDRQANLIGAGGASTVSSARNDALGMIRPNGDFRPARPGALAKGETDFFGIRDSATQFTYVVDVSGSMAGIALLAAKAELKKSIERLDATQKFQIIFYSDTPEVMKIRGAADGSLIWATTLNKRLAWQNIDGVQVRAGTKHMPALKKALRMRPEVIYFLTDADEPILRAPDLAEIKQLNNGRTRIHCIEFGKVADLGIENFLRRLTRQNGGTYRYRDVSQFKRRR